jgi:hypothetical protein
MSSRTTQTCGGTLRLAGSSNIKSAAGEARSLKPHAAATSAETPSDSATEKETDLKENETGLFKAFQEGKYGRKFFGCGRRLRDR